MYLVALAWMYVVVMMSVAEATGANGSVLGALVTLLMYGLLPLSVVMYLLHTPARRAARRRVDEAETAGSAVGATVDPDGGGHAAGDTVAPERKEP